MVTTKGEEPALVRLEEIEQDLATALTTGALYPDRREEAARQVMALYQEGVAISEQPGAYRWPEPWTIEDDARREMAVRQTVLTVFRGAAGDDPLTDALIEHWMARMLEASAKGQPKRYNAESKIMRDDAELARRTKLSANPFRMPEHPQDPGLLLKQLETLTARARQGLEAKSGRKQTTWIRAGKQALHSLEATIRWVHEERSDGGSEAGRQATAEEAARLAHRFNEIRHAIGQRCQA